MPEMFKPFENIKMAKKFEATGFKE